VVIEKQHHTLRLTCDSLLLLHSKQILVEKGFTHISKITLQENVVEVKYRTRKGGTKEFMAFHTNQAAELYNALNQAVQINGSRLETTNLGNS
jgi:hypothetical protein